MIWLAFGAHLVVSIVFFLAAASKLADLPAFVGNVQEYRILSRSWAKPFAISLPIIELGAATMLVTGFHTGIAAGVIAALLLVFMAAIGVAIRRGYELRCGCLGLLYHTETIGWHTMLRDAVPLILVLVVAAYPEHPTLLSLF